MAMKYPLRSYAAGLASHDGLSTKSFIGTTKTINPNNPLISNDINIKKQQNID